MKLGFQFGSSGIKIGNLAAACEEILNPRRYVLLVRVSIKVEVDAEKMKESNIQSVGLPSRSKWATNGPAVVRVT